MVGIILPSDCGYSADLLTCSLLGGISHAIYRYSTSSVFILLRLPMPGHLYLVCISTFLLVFSVDPCVSVGVVCHSVSGSMGNRFVSLLVCWSGMCVYMLS